MVTGSDSRSSADGWRFWYAGPRPGAEQMAIDAALLRAFRSGGIGPVFRLFTWHPPAVSLGFHQDPARELDLEQVARRRYDVVLRPTGGRAILHDGELTYTVVAAADDPLVGGTLRDSHAAISRIFLSALRTLGVAAEVAAHVPGGGAADGAGAGGEVASSTGGEAVPTGGAALPCFATTTPAELVVNGRKILGSAQRRHGNAFLQHGSLLVTPGHLELAELLRLPAGRRAAYAALLARTTTDLSAEMGRVPRVAEVIDAVAAAIGERMGRPVRFTQEPLG